MKNLKILIISLLLIATSSVLFGENESEKDPGANEYHAHVEAGEFNAPAYLGGVPLEHHLVVDPEYMITGQVSWTIYKGNTQTVYRQFSGNTAINWDTLSLSPANLEMPFYRIVASAWIQEGPYGSGFWANIREFNVTNLGEDPNGGGW